MRTDDEINAKATAVLLIMAMRTYTEEERSKRFSRTTLLCTQGWDDEDRARVCFRVLSRHPDALTVNRSLSTCRDWIRDRRTSYGDDGGLTM